MTLDDAKELLVAATLRGHPQRFFGMHSTPLISGDCAAGVLHLSLHETQEQALACQDPFYEVIKAFQLDQPSVCPLCSSIGFSTTFNLGNLIVHLNDTHGFDFLTIARKLPDGPTDRSV